MTYRDHKHAVCLALFLGMPSGVLAGSWTCENDGVTRQVVVFYPDAPARLPCKVFYARPDENVLPRALWQASNTPGYCEQKAVEFIEKLGSFGWRCRGDEPEE
jgi:hypothetical protein